MRDSFVTTYDNPFNPFEDFTNWLKFDHMMGYYTDARIARLTGNTDNLSEQDENQEIDRAVDTLLKYDFAGLWHRVYDKEVTGNLQQN